MDTRATVLESLTASAKSKALRVCFPETYLDERVATASKHIQDQGLATVVPLWWQGKHSTEKTYHLLCSTAAAKGKPLPEQQPYNELTLAGAMLALGEVDVVVAGAHFTTALVLKAALQTIGLREGNNTLSSFFLMQFLDRDALLFADCGVVPNPSESQLADIAISTSESAQKILNVTPKVAMLSFSTLGSADHADVRKVRNATMLVRQRAPWLEVEGEIQADVALVPHVAASKAPGSRVQGDARVLVFPTLDAGNIAYKVTERLAKATAIGPVLQGLRKPYCDLSRGCSVSDIIDAFVVSAHL
jgi:phosphate acetyltransferase